MVDIREYVVKRETTSLGWSRVVSRTYVCNEKVKQLVDITHIFMCQMLPIIVVILIIYSSFDRIKAEVVTH